MRSANTGHSQFRIPWRGIVGCITGVLLSFYFNFVLFKSSYNQPVLYENLDAYQNDLRNHHNFNFMNGYNIYRAQASGNRTFTEEEAFLTNHVKLLCYTSDDDSENTEHTMLIFTTWLKYCDYSFLFYKNKRFAEDVVLQNVKYPKNIQLLYVTNENDTMTTLFSIASQLSGQYHWLVYVPANVFFIPSNMRYFLHALQKNSSDNVLIGQASATVITNEWRLKESSPFLASHGAISQVLRKPLASCHSDKLYDPTCVIESCPGSPLYDLRDNLNNPVMVSMKYSNFWIQFENIDVVNSIKTRFPVSVYINGARGSYKFFIEMEYYIHHLKAYGHVAHGTMVQNRTNNPI